MDKVNRRVMPIPTASKGQNQNHQRDQNAQQQNKGNGDNSGQSVFEVKKTSVPVPCVFGDYLGGDRFERKFKTARWEITTANLKTSVKINAVIDGDAPDGPATVQVIHIADGKMPVLIESVSGFLDKGVITASWLTKDKVPNWREGVYRFWVIAGGAREISSNALKLS